jgi:hypothetical protein
MRRQLGRSIMAARAAFGGAPTPSMALTVAVVAGAPPPGDGLGREAPVQRRRRGLEMAARFWGLKRPSGGVYIGERCCVIHRDSKADFISNLILSSMIIGRIQKGIETSSLRSKTLLWLESFGPTAWARVDGLAAAARDVGRGATRLRPAVEGGDWRGQTQCARRHEQGIRILGVGPRLGQSGRLEWGSCCKRKMEGKRKGKWATRFSAQNSLGERKAFLFSKFFMNFQTNLNSNQTRTMNDFYLQNKI